MGYGGRSKVEMDKILAVIIIFIAMMFLMAAVLAMGAVPKIFQTGEKIDQTLIQKHEDEARESQKFQIIQETNKSLNQSMTTLENRLYKFMNLSAERSEKGQQERQKIIDEILNVSSQHDKVAKDHNILQTKVQNMTEQIYDLLKDADERNYLATINNTKILVNLTEELKEIKLRLP